MNPTKPSGTGCPNEDAAATAAALVKVFTYADGRTFRTVVADGVAWFCNNDLCGFLEHSNPRLAAKVVETADKKVFSAAFLQARLGVVSNTYTPRGGWQDMLFVNEFGLYQLIMRSNKPEARAFQYWITHEVIPAIRRTGHYGIQPAASPDLSVLSDLRRDIATWFGGIEARLDTIDQRLDGIDVRLDHIDTRLDHIDSRLDSLDTRVTGVEAGVRRVEARVTRVETTLNRAEARLLRVEQAAEESRPRLTNLEANTERFAHAWEANTQAFTKLANKPDRPETASVPSVPEQRRRGVDEDLVRLFLQVLRQGVIGS